MNPKSSKAVDQIDSNNKLIARFASQRQAEKATGIAASHIAKVCRGDRKSAGGYQWKLTK